MNESAPITILMADDDEDDRLLALDATRESGAGNALVVVEDGVELLEYLRHEGRWAEECPPTPALILLDLNMPRLDGWSTLTEIKADERLRHIPVIVLTTSKAEEDVLSSYARGAASFITKPVSYQRLVELMRSLDKYWGDFVQLPGRQAPEALCAH